MMWDVALINLVQDTSPRWYRVNTVFTLPITYTFGSYLDN